MTATASVRFGADGTAEVQSYVRLTASTHIQCCTYPDAAPILTIRDGQVDIVITNPGRGEVTEDDVAFGRVLAEAVTRYGVEADPDPVRVRAGWITDEDIRAMAYQIAEDTRPLELEATPL
jgi:hypothetical protein